MQRNAAFGESSVTKAPAFAARMDPGIPVPRASHGPGLPAAFEESAMKTPLLVLAIAASGIAHGAGVQRELAPVTVHSTHADCTPPSASAPCSALHAQIRQAFTSREIGMLFGTRTSYPEPQPAYARLEARYRDLVREVAADIARADAVAAR